MIESSIDFTHPTLVRDHKARENVIYTIVYTYLHFAICGVIALWFWCECKIVNTTNIYAETTRGMKQQRAAEISRSRDCCAVNFAVCVYICSVDKHTICTQLMPFLAFMNYVRCIRAARIHTSSLHTHERMSAA